MLKKFEEFVNERLFNQNIKRASNKDVRTEDKLNGTNLYDLKPIDLGFETIVFADQDLVVDGDEFAFTGSDWEKISDKVRLTGWRLPTHDDMIDTFFKDYALVKGIWLKTNKEDTTIRLVSELVGDTETELIFPVESLDFSARAIVEPGAGDTGHRVLDLNPKYANHRRNRNLSITERYIGGWRTAFRIRLVKDKDKI